MQRVPEQQRNFPLAMMSRCLVIMPGTVQIQEAKPTMLVREIPIHGVCTICMGTSGNGCGITGMEIITAHQLMEVPGKVALTGFFGAAAGTSTPGIAVQRIAATSTPTTTATSLAFAS
jgi:hypothetical protein